MAGFIRLFSIQTKTEQKMICDYIRLGKQKSNIEQFSEFEKNTGTKYKKKIEKSVNRKNNPWYK